MPQAAAALAPPPHWPLPPPPFAALPPGASSLAAAHARLLPAGWPPATVAPPPSLLPAAAAPPPPPPGLPGEAAAALTTAAAALAAGDPRAALAAIVPAYAAASGAPAVLLLVGAAHAAAGAAGQAAAFCDAAVAASPRLPEAHAALADCLAAGGRLDLALLYYRSALTLRPSYPAALNNMGAALAAAGAAGAAGIAYRAALAALGGQGSVSGGAPPSPPLPAAVADVAANLGDLLRSPFGAAAVTTPGESPAVESAAAYSAALAAAPAHARALAGAASLAAASGDEAAAATAYAAAVAADPGSADARAGLACALASLGRHAEAETAARSALAASPSSPAALAAAIAVARARGDAAAALAAAQAAAAAAPGSPDAFNDLGNALHEAGRPGDAVAAYDACLRLQLAPTGAGGGLAAAALAPLAAAPSLSSSPAAARLATAYTNMANALRACGRGDDAVAAFERAALLAPASAAAAASLGAALKDAGRHGAAVDAYKRALALDPGTPGALAHLVHSAGCVADWSGRSEALTALAASTRADLAAGVTPAAQPFHVMAYPWPADLVVALARAHATAAAAAAAAAVGPAGWVPPPSRPALAPLPPGTRLRVAFLSSDFGNHPLTHLMASVPGLLKTGGKVEANFYATAPPDGSPWRAAIETAAEHFADVSGWPAAAVAAAIARDGCHVSVNLNGYTKGARGDVFALRPAPAAVSYMGFPGTLADPAVPWLITDSIASPDASAPWYGDALARMPGCYFVNDYRQAYGEGGGGGESGTRGAAAAAAVATAATAPPTRKSLGLPPHPTVVFGCACQAYKVDPQTLNAWARVLAAVPSSVLWLLRFPPAAEPRLRAEAEARGIGSERLVFTDVAPRDAHVARSALATLHLDTLPVNAHTTACDVLWAGAPIVTLPGGGMASRVCASIVDAAGVGPECVATSVDDYVDKAVRLGSNPGALEALRAKLVAGRATSRLWDTPRWTRDFERTLHAVWERSVAGNVATFDVGEAGEGGG